MGDSVYAKLARKIKGKLGQEHKPEITYQIIMATAGYQYSGTPQTDSPLSNNALNHVIEDTSEV